MSSDLKTQYDRDGFVTVRQLLPPEEFAELYRELDRYIRTVVPRCLIRMRFMSINRGLRH